MKNILLTLITTVSLFSVQGQTTVFSENFDGATLSVTSSNTAATAANWAINSNLQVSGSNSDTARVNVGDSVILTTNNFSTIGFSFVTLNFNQICKVDFFDKAIIQISTDNQASWTQLTTNEYTGTGNLFQNSFASVSYSVWDPGNPNSIPTQSWWQSESFDLSSYINNAQVAIRFVLIDTDNNGARGNYGWLLDDLEVLGSSCELIPPAIALTGTVFQGRVYTTGPYLVEADIQDASGIASARLEYTVNNGIVNSLSMANTSGNTYEATIPSRLLDDTVCYTIYATDATTCGNVAQFPATCTEFIISPNPPPTCLGAAVSNYPYAESFASFTAGNGNFNNPIPGTLNNNWENETNDTHDWWVYDQGTQSGGTGPTAAHSTTDPNYLYVESSGGFNNRTAILNTPCYDLTNGNLPKFSFWYHMFGAVMGELHLDAFFGGQWVLDIIPAYIGAQGNQWNFKEVDLSPYNGALVKLRFRAITGSGFASDIAIDDIELLDPLVDDIAVNRIVTPNALSCGGSASEFVTVELENLGTADQNSTPLAYRVNGGTIVRDTANLNIASGSVVNHTFQQPFNMASIGNYDIEVWLELASDQLIDNDSILNFTVSRGIANTTFPDTSTFDNFIQGVPGTLLDGWENSSNDDIDWFVNSGGTPSNTTTGPSSDTIRGNSNYMYIEATNSFNLEAQLISKCYDISTLNQPELSFFYHMYGASMGEMHLDISINGFVVQDIIPAKVGDMGNQWLNETLDLSPYKGIVKLIFRGITGPSFRSDMAIDAVSIRDAQPVGLSEEVSINSTFSFYPNPSATAITLISSSAEGGRLRVFSSTGQLVEDRQIIQKRSTISIDHLENGVYFIECSSENGLSERKKLIKVN